MDAIVRFAGVVSAAFIIAWLLGYQISMGNLFFGVCGLLLWARTEYLCYQRKRDSR